MSTGDYRESRTEISEEERQKNVAQQIPQKDGAAAFTDNLVAGYDTAGFDAGSLLPTEVGPCIRIGCTVVKDSGEQLPFGLCFDAETAVAMAKSILATAATLGVKIDE